MAQPISKFFKELRFPFRNDRWSWGARDGNVLLLRTWAHEYSLAEKRVNVLHAGVPYEGYAPRDVPVLVAMGKAHRPQIERDADYFSTCCLAPLKLVRAELKEFLAAFHWC